MAEYGEFGRAAAAVFRGGTALYPTAWHGAVEVRPVLGIEAGAAGA